MLNHPVSVYQLLYVYMSVKNKMLCGNFFIIIKQRDLPYKYINMDLKIIPQLRMLSVGIY